MTSKYIPNPIPQRKNASKGAIQRVEELSALVIIPIFGTPAADDKSLPLTIERKYGQKFGKKKDKDGKKISIGEGWLETEAVFEKRVHKKFETFDRTFLKRKTKISNIQHYKS